MQTSILSAIINEPVFVKSIPVIQPRNWWQRTLRRKPKQTVRDLYLKDVSMSTFHRIQALTLQLQRDSEPDAPYHSFTAYHNTPILATIIATAIEDGAPTPELIEAVMDNFTNSELHQTAEQVYRGLDYDPFWNTTVLFLNLKPTDIQETKAHGQSSDQPK